MVDDIRLVFLQESRKSRTEVTMKKILYIDMDNVIVDFKSGISRLSQSTRDEFVGHLDDVPGIFALMDPMPGAIESVNKLRHHYDTYVLSTAPWANPSAWSDKVEWIHRYFGDHEETPLYKRLILSHHKNLNAGDFLIDDRTANGVEQFKGEHIHFGQGDWPDWEKVTNYLIELVITD
jgi:5'-nucleotidase